MFWIPLFQGILPGFSAEVWGNVWIKDVNILFYCLMPSYYREILVVLAVPSELCSEWLISLLTGILQGLFSKMRINGNFQE
jgi:hypothetical protein